MTQFNPQQQQPEQSQQQLSGVPPRQGQLQGQLPMQGQPPQQSQPPHQGQPPQQAQLPQQGLQSAQAMPAQQGSMQGAMPMQEHAQAGAAGQIAPQGQEQSMQQVQPMQPMQAQGQGMAEMAGQAPVAPQIDVIETPEDVLVFVDLPGCEEDDIKIRAEGGRLTIEAKRKADYDEEEEETKMFQRERPTQANRTIDLPSDANIEEATAEYENGVAKITLPKSEGQRRREIGFQ